MTKIGIDLFGVTFKTVYNGEVASKAEFIPGAIDGISELVKRFGKENCFIISFIAKPYEKDCRDVLHKLKFYELTGFEEQNVNFVHSESKFRRDKPKTIASLGITDYIDDHLRFLNKVSEQTRLYWFTIHADAEVEEFRLKNDCLDCERYPHFRDWPTLVKTITGSH